MAAPKGKPKLTREEAVERMATLMEDFLEQFPERERQARVRRFAKRVDKLTAARTKRARSR